MLRIRDLTDNPSPHVMLLCSRCGGEYSAYRGDYFMAPPDTVMKCGHCKGAMRIVEKQTRYIEVRA